MNGHRDWAARARDGVILLVAVGILAGETMGQLFAGRPADLTLVGAALALLGIVPKLSKGNGE